MLTQMEALQSRFTSLESRSISREEFFQVKTGINSIPTDRLSRCNFIELPKGWEPAKEYFRKDPSKDPIIDRGTSEKPREYEDPKLKTVDYADKEDCYDSDLAAKLQLHSKGRQVQMKFELSTNRPIVRNWIYCIS